jgi:reactive intermediate/imine deaminase
MAEIEVINPEGLPALGPYSHVITVRGGKTVYVAGQVAVNSEGEVVGRGDLREQTRQVFENVQAALAAAGATFDDVVKVTMYVANYKPEDRAILMDVRNQYISGERLPTSVLLGVQSLATNDLLIEMDAIAVVD